MIEKFLLRHSANLWTEGFIMYANESAPPSPDNFSSPEKQKAAGEGVREAASQTPSQIASSAVQAGGGVKTKYQTSTQALAGLIDDAKLQ